MPVITIEVAEATRKQKSRIAKEMTKALAKIIRMPEETIFVFIKENAADNVGVGGKLLSDLRERAAR